MYAQPEAVGTRIASACLCKDLHLNTTIDEKDGTPTYAAVTSRSLYPGDVHAVFGEVSVDDAKCSIAVTAWCAFGTTACCEFSFTDLA